MYKNEKNALFINSFLLQYPDNSWFYNITEVLKEISKMKDEVYALPILKFLQLIKGYKSMDLEELYVDTFDFTKETNLYMTNHIFNEDMERGNELINLKKKYSEAGLYMAENELPDFLPVMLEFVYVVEDRTLLNEYKDIIGKIFERLLKKDNPYLYVFKSILLLLGTVSKTEDEMEDNLFGGVD